MAGKALSEQAWVGIRERLGMPADTPHREVVAEANRLIDESEFRVKAATTLGLPAGSSQAQILAEVDRLLARQSAPAALQASTPAPKPASRRIAAATANDPQAHYARNPCVAETQARGEYQWALDADPNVPTVFASGDAPPFTASGLDPKILANVPWYGRHALAAQPDKGKALQMYEAMTGPDGITAAAEYLGHAGNEDYRQRVTNWVIRGNDLRRDRQLEAERAQVAAAATAVVQATGPQEDWTDEQVFEHLFGETDRQRAEEAAVRAKAVSLGEPPLISRRGR